MRILITNVLVDDQAKAHDFYTGKLGFVVKNDVPAGGARWLTVTSPEDTDGVELLLEPNGNPGIQINGEPAARVYQRTLHEAGIPYTLFFVDDVDAEYARLRGLGVEFQGEPQDVPGGRQAVLDDTCGNLIGLMEVTGDA
ncbi:catechol 2,3-dioxygenase-like lactoylglutathione lyase family enzyme [Stackebrandtia albiflava]|uniref:Catechol 2,3-dioxygenase-like lactoylglutathione lyase family enzyme n=1 Tax=Stackebrandtia albiflava TaxID=406432 RepID=A0A562VAA3_9ACTN|nr:VOC family protein [Stackebrandtia albiflava]TWJ14778.1 catechol 2,3-dioxygenase-like lactoylglutathione lyase family enzyme [Stackebrandtia albiflava]